MFVDDKFITLTNSNNSSYYFFLNYKNENIITVFKDDSNKYCVSINIFDRRISYDKLDENFIFEMKDKFDLLLKLKNKDKIYA